MEPPPNLPKEIDKVADELDSLNTLVTVLVVVFILFVILQIIQTVFKILKPKQKILERHCKPNAVVVQGKATRTSKRESSSRKSSSRRESLPSKRMSTILSLSTESECEKSTKSSKELCGSGEECKEKKTTRPIPSLDISKEMANDLKMLNCSDVVNTPLPSTAPLAVPHSSSKSKESIEDSTKEKKKDSPIKTAPTPPTQPLSSLPSNHKAPPTQATPTQAPPPQAPPPQAPPTQAPPTQTTPASKNSPTVDTTQRGSIVEILTPKKNSPVKTAKEEVKTTPISVPTTIPQ